MKKKERLVYYYDLSISVKSRDFDAPKPISVKEAFKLIQEVRAEKRTKELSKGNEFIYVSDLEWSDDDIISILINKSDKGMSDPVFTVPKEEKRRTIEKKEKEGQDFSVHIIIKLPNNDIDSALVIIEYCPGLSISTIKRLLNQILSNAKKECPDNFKQNHPDGEIDNYGKSKTYSVTCKCELDGHISNELKSDLDSGKVQSIELITDKEQYTSFDEEGRIQEKCKTLVLTLKDNEHPIRDQFNRITNVIKKQKDDYSKAKIKFKTSSGLNRTVEMQTTDGLAQAYVKKEKLDGFESDLKSSYDKLNKTILNKMKELLPSETQ